MKGLHIGEHFIALLLNVRRLRVRIFIGLLQLDLHSGFKL